jgi:pyruvate,water dikinase
MHFFISDLSELGTMRNAERSVGAKMARLGKVMAAGYAVPRGFVLDVSAYREAIDQEEVAAAVAAAMEGVSAESTPEELSKVRPQIHDALSSYVFQEDLFDSLREALEGLGEGVRVAVRSSAVGEDSAKASFAGQFETKLGVVGFDAMMTALRRCWSSPFSASALAYRAAHGLLETPMPMAVGVLELIEPRVAGVAFSVHPVTRRKNRVVVEANWGLGETVVSGRVSPDHAEVGKVDLRILDYSVGGKQLVAAFDEAAAAVVERASTPDEAASRCLSDDEVMAVAATTVELEQLFGHPVDVEWALVSDPDGGATKVVILQVRPETIREEPMAVSEGYDPIRMILERTSRKLATGG